MADREGLSSSLATSLSSCLLARACISVDARTESRREPLGENFCLDPAAPPSPVTLIALSAHRVSVRV